MMFDSHCHLNHPDFAGDIDSVIRAAHTAGVDQVMVPGYDLNSSRRAAELAAGNEGLFAAAGIHPHDATTWTPDSAAALRELWRLPCVRAVGECGLDFFRDHSPRETQKRVFRSQVRLARENGMPLIVHVREAFDEVLAILREEDANDVGGVLHCFTGDGRIAERALELGFHLGFTGAVTYRWAEPVREAVRIVPRDRLLVETDAPWMLPRELRKGKRRNEPCHLPAVVAAVAECRSMTGEEVAVVSVANARRLFGCEVGVGL